MHYRAVRLWCRSGGGRTPVSGRPIPWNVVADPTRFKGIGPFLLRSDHLEPAFVLRQGRLVPPCPFVFEVPRSTAQDAGLAFDGVGIIRTETEGHRFSTWTSTPAAATIGDLNGQSLPPPACRAQIGLDSTWPGTDGGGRPVDDGRIPPFHLRSPSHPTHLLLTAFPELRLTAAGRRAKVPLERSPFPLPARPRCFPPAPGSGTFRAYDALIGSMTWQISPPSRRSTLP